MQQSYSDLELALTGKVDGGYVENNALYLTSGGEVVAGPFEGIGGGGGGGGGGSTNTAVITVTNTTGWVSRTIASGSPLTLSLTWSSIEDNMPTGTPFDVKAETSVKSGARRRKACVVPLGEYRHRL